MDGVTPSGSIQLAPPTTITSATLLQLGLLATEYRKLLAMAFKNSQIWYDNLHELHNRQYCDAQISTRVSTSTITADPGTCRLNGYFRTLIWSGEWVTMVKRSVKWTVSNGRQRCSLIRHCKSTDKPYLTRGEPPTPWVVTTGRWGNSSDLMTGPVDHARRTG